LPNLGIPAVESKDVWGHITYNQTWPYDVASRCDHTGTFNASDDTWTATGLEGWYDQNTQDPAYVSAQWEFYRGFGGGGEAHDYETDSDMYCAYQFGSYAFGHYDDDDPAFGYGPWGNVPAYYHSWTKYLSSFFPTLPVSIRCRVVHSPISKIRIIQMIDGMYLRGFTRCMHSILVLGLPNGNGHEVLTYE